MRILVNTTNLCVGGGVQKAVQFFLACRRHGRDHSWRFVLSPQVRASLDTVELPDWMSSISVETSPARIVAGRTTRRRLLREESKFRPDVVFSVSGPSYHRFRRPHLMGFAIGWITHPSDLAWTSVGPLQRRILFGLRLKYYAFWARFADEWLLQTKTAAAGLAMVMGADRRRFHVVPNSCSDYYIAAREMGAPGEARAAVRDDAFRWLVITSYKAHKNLEIIPEVAAALRARGVPHACRFVLTLPEDSAPWRALHDKAQRLGVAEDLTTVGPVLVRDGPGVYTGCDGVFSPTVLETFSATYPEAMCLDRPVVTSDLDFARDICRDAAVYFDPADPTDAARAITEVVDSEELRRRLVEAGRRRLIDFGTGEERFAAVVRILEEMVSRYGGIS